MHEHAYLVRFTLRGERVMTIVSAPSAPAAVSLVCKAHGVTAADIYAIGRHRPSLFWDGFAYSDSERFV